MAAGLFSLTNMRVLSICIGVLYAGSGLGLWSVALFAEHFTAAMSVPGLNLKELIPQPLWYMVLLPIMTGIATALCGWFYLRTWNWMPWLALISMLLMGAVSWLTVNHMTEAAQQLIRDLPGNGILYKRQLDTFTRIPLLMSAIGSAIPLLVLFWVTLRNRTRLLQGDTLDL